MERLTMARRCGHTVENTAVVGASAWRIRKGLYQTSFNNASYLSQSLLKMVYASLALGNKACDSGFLKMSG